jgi:hypothetical protein
MLRVIKNQPSLKNDIYFGPHCQLAFQACWNPTLNNPILNKLYKESVPYTERWFLEVRKLINEGTWHHPLLVSIIYDNKLKTDLVKSTVIDGASMRSILSSDEFPEFHISASVNLKKSERWCAFFTSLPSTIEILADLNGPTRG